MDRIDLSALIAALEDIDRQLTRQGQLNRLELLLVEAELNPNPLPFQDITSALDLLGQVANREALPWSEAQLGLEPFFA